MSVITHRPTVSILTRPSGRVQPRQRQGVRACRSGFNPHAARRPGATARVPPMSAAPGEVSILTRPSGRVQPSNERRFDKPCPVSILTRPEGRVQPPPGTARGSACPRFNPHPARRPGATTPTGATYNQSVAVSIPPGQKAGCNTARASDGPGPLVHVSILTRPSGRVQQRNSRRRQHAVLVVSILTRPEGRVQHRHQPRYRGPPVDVSILTRPEGRVQRAGPLLQTCQMAVSILTRPSGRVQPM